LYNITSVAKVLRTILAIIARHEKIYL